MQYAEYQFDSYIWNYYRTSVAARKRSLPMTTFIWSIATNTPS